MKMKSDRRAGAMTGNQLREIRKASGKTQKEFADALGYKKGGSSKISEMENGKRSISGSIIELLYWMEKAGQTSL